MTHVIALEAGQSARGSYEPIKPADAWPILYTHNIHANSITTYNNRFIHGRNVLVLYVQTRLIIQFWYIQIYIKNHKRLHTLKNDYVFIKMLDSMYVWKYSIRIHYNTIHLFNTIQYTYSLQYITSVHANILSTMFNRYLSGNQ